MQLLSISCFITAVLGFQPNQGALLGKTKSWSKRTIMYGTLGQKRGDYSCAGNIVKKDLIKSSVLKGAKYIKHKTAREGMNMEPHWQTIIQEKDYSILIEFDEITGNGLNLRGILLQQRGQDWKEATICQVV